MALRIATRLPRLAVLGAVLMLASATLAVGAAKRMSAVPKGAPAPAKRPPAFVVAGAPKEPLHEMPLVQRAKLLSTWIASHPRTPATVRHFLYQNSWVVTGARFGWWHGADALRELIAADRLAQK